jgi:DNA-directed RNA polymerase specialized sigma subunit
VKTLAQAIRGLTDGPYSVNLSKLAREIGISRQSLHSVYATNKTIEAIAEKLEIPASELRSAMVDDEEEN